MIELYVPCMHVRFAQTTVDKFINYVNEFRISTRYMTQNFDFCERDKHLNQT